jgi:23S rRNA (cytidine1920-2'-O)/16S rRNA (cytidine1409-2'-O)-methyltransferase
MLLLERGLADSRSRAQALIRAGKVRVDGQVADKPGTSVRHDCLVEVIQPDPYVSRAGPKLAHALSEFGVDPAGWVCLDVGSSTGGFTDVLLQSGAEVVYAVDVGRGQLAWRLRNDPRVVCMERTDIRSVSDLRHKPQLATIDVAFISLRLVLPPVARLLAPSGQAIALIKPQFEAGRDSVPRGGVVRDKAVHAEVLRAVLGAAEAGGWRILGATASPVTGAAGNREFLAHLKRGVSASSDCGCSVEEAVLAAISAVGN